MLIKTCKYMFFLRLSGRLFYVFFAINWFFPLYAGFFWLDSGLKERLPEALEAMSFQHGIVRWRESMTSRACFNHGRIKLPMSLSHFVSKISYAEIADSTKLMQSIST